MKTGKISSTIELLGKCQSEGVEVIDVNELRKQAKPLFSCKWIAYLVLGVCSIIFFRKRFWKQQVPPEHMLVVLGSLKPYEIISFGLVGMRPFWVHPTILHLIKVKLEDATFVKEVISNLKKELDL